ncbi:hypothetical protein QQ008_09460 [Fulvivirgaceae bacterium BMA10]|uniref:Lipocalin-like domain-containing protein n=1 Tax=Splendidivirga corallicola TaxID=3051826 RepID=A0ABT8KLI8_9BACT|nr:hypothetical protein [Fulvivirgaceae bacterium BMA10]
MKNICLVLLVFGVFSCESSKNKTDLLLGTWDATWKLKDKEVLNIKGIDCAVMNGEISFDHNGQVKIRAFGHEGCIFSQDTMLNTMTWKLKQNKLEFITESGKTLFSYEVDDFQKEDIRLKLLNEVDLDLKRKNF